MEKYYLLTHNADWADEHNVPSLSCMNQKTYDKWLNTKIYPGAYLGNGGDDWCEELKGMTGQELIKNKEVSKTIVDESFYKTFNKAGLEHLSLSNIFDLDQYNYDEDVEEDEDVSYEID